MNLLDKKVKEIGIDINICKILANNRVITIGDLCLKKRSELKSYDLNNSEINQVMIKMQLLGLDLDKKRYDIN